VQTGNAEIHRKQFSRSILVTSMSLACHEEIGCVVRVERGCYEDASDLSATSRACRLVEFEERHDTRTNGKHYTEADRRPTNQVSA